MKLSASLIVEKLGESYSVHTGSPLSVRPELEHIHLFSNDQPLCENTIYIVPEGGSIAEPDDCPENSLFLFIRQTDDPSGQYPATSCQISGTDPDPMKLMDRLVSIFQYYNNWYEKLVSIRLDDGSIQSMLEASYEIFHNPLMVIGMDFTIIAKIFPDAMPVSENIYGSSEDVYIYLSALRQDPLFNQSGERSGCFLIPNSASGVTSLCVNIRKYKVTTYRLLLPDYDKRPNENLGFLLELLAKMMEHTLLHNTVRRVSHDNSLHAVFLHILSDRTSDYVKISQQLDSLGWYSRSKYFCMVLQPAHPDPQNLTASAVCTYVQNSIGSCCALPFKDGIAAYVNLTKAKINIANITQILDPFIRDNHLNAGFSRALTGHLNLRRQYLQALQALRVGRLKSPSQWLYLFNDIAFDYILEESTKALPGYMISHEKLLQLKALDENNHTEYLKTLRVYLDNHLNAVQSARMLYIHRSTFLYRLEKIRAVLETDFNDPDEILYLMLSFRFIDMENQTDEE